MPQYFPAVAAPRHRSPDQIEALENTEECLRRKVDGEEGVEGTGKGRGGCLCCAGSDEASTSVGMPQEFCSLCSSQEISPASNSTPSARRLSAPASVTASGKRKVDATARRLSDTPDYMSPSNSTQTSQTGERGHISKQPRSSEDTYSPEDTPILSSGCNDSISRPLRRSLPPLTRTSYEYISIQTLLSQIDAADSLGVQAILKRHTMVGVVSCRYMLVQHETRLLLLDHSMLALHLFYQLAVTRFGEMRPVRLTNAVSVKDYVRCALDLPAAQWTPEDGSKEQVSSAVSTLLLSKSPMLRKYFSIEFIPGDDDSGSAMLVSIPELLEEYSPLPENLPLFLLRLATVTDWENEMNCFADVCKELALFYSELPKDELGCGSATVLCSRAKEVLLSQLIPAVQAYLLPPKEFMSDGTVVQVAALEQLYKVFERC